MKKIPKRIRNHVNPLSILHTNKIDLFDNKKKVIIDIGAYRGEFTQQLLDYFKEEKNFIVFEIRKPFYEYLKKIFDQNDNVRVYDGDAGKSLKGMVIDLKNAGNKIDKIFVNFPDPWFKERHKKRRFINEKILKDFVGVLDLDSEIIFQTDQKQLFKETIDLIKKNGNFKIKKFNQPLFNVQSYWEKMKIKEGNKIYRMKIFLKDKNKSWWKFW